MGASRRSEARRPGEYRPGEVYSVRQSKESFAAVKILAIEQDVVHVCLYSQRFPERPSAVRLETLAVLPAGEGEGLGMFHLPISRKDFDRWKPRLLLRADVTDRELAGYNLWKSSGGGAWG
jgi:hypothetical protein